MFSQICHNGGRRVLLIVALMSGVSWSGLAAAQPSPTDIAAAKVKLAKARVAEAEAELELLQAGGKAAAIPEAPSPSEAAPKMAEADTSPKTTPELGEGEGVGDTTKPEDEEEPGKGDGPDNGSTPGNGNKEVAKGRQEFGGLEFGVGISFTADVGSNDRVTEAELVNGLVRVKDEDNGRARIMLESHYFFKPCQNPNGTPMAKENCSLPFGLTGGDFGWGPFIALQPGTDNIIEAVAIGGMVGFRRPGTGTESFNLGLGVVIDPNTRILGDGIVANEPLPVGETTIRYKEKMQTGVLLLASFGF